MADFDFTQLKGRMAQAGKGGHVELSDLERNALITNAIDGGSVDPEEVQELIDESLEGYYNKFEVDSELNTKSDKSDTYTKSEVNALIPSVDNDIIIGALPSSGVANTIYRVPGTDSYTDYAWDGTQFVPLGTFTGNPIPDATPTANSTNPVQSGGVYNELKIIGTRTITPDSVDGLTLRTGVINSSTTDKCFYIQGSQGDIVHLYLSSYPSAGTWRVAFGNAVHAIAEKFGLVCFDFENVLWWYFRTEPITTSFPNPDRQDGRWVKENGETTPATIEGYNRARFCKDSVHPTLLGYQWLADPIGYTLLNK